VRVNVLLGFVLACFLRFHVHEFIVSKAGFIIFKHAQTYRLHQYRMHSFFWALLIDCLRWFNQKRGRKIL